LFWQAGRRARWLVEGEIGDIGTGSEVREQAQSLSSSLTTPTEAKEFVEATGIDILAPAVGNTHGMLKSLVQGGTKKRLDIARIAQIKTAVQIPLTPAQAAYCFPATSIDHATRRFAARARYHRRERCVAR
jgi:fructose/tagatose bisphosphate aldolase